MQFRGAGSRMSRRCRTVDITFDDSTSSHLSPWFASGLLAPPRPLLRDPRSLRCCFAETTRVLPAISTASSSSQTATYLPPAILTENARLQRPSSSSTSVSWTASRRIVDDPGGEVQPRIHWSTASAIFVAPTVLRILIAIIASAVRIVLTSECAAAHNHGGAQISDQWRRMPQPRGH